MRRAPAHARPHRSRRTGVLTVLLAAVLAAVTGSSLLVTVPSALAADGTTVADDPYADPEGRGRARAEATYSAPPAPSRSQEAALVPGEEVGSGFSVVDLTGGRRSNASGINEDGDVSGTMFLDGESIPVVWRDGELTQLDAPATPTRIVRAMAIGDDGTIGGWQLDRLQNKRYAVAWSRNRDGSYGSMQRIAEVEWSSESFAYGGEVKAVSKDGALLVTEPVELVPRGSELIWHHGGWTELTPQPAEPFGIGAANDMNNHETAVGLMIKERWGSVAASVWARGGGTGAFLPDSPWATPDQVSTALAVNDDGDVVVSVQTAERSVAALYEADGTWTDLGSVGSSSPVTNLEVWDVNNKDAVVGAAHVTVDGVPTRHAFLWRDGQAVDLNNYLPAQSGWELTAAHSINERGQIVGIGWHRGVETAFLLDPTAPLLFVPGAGASILKSFDDPSAPEELWLGCGSDRMKLSLFDEDNPPRDVRAVDATRYMDCYGLNGRSVGALDAYGTFLDAMTQRFGYREYQVDERVERRTTEGCDLSQRDQAPNLFVFAYDWRKDNRISARQLEDYIGCIRKFFPDTDIDVVTHSMGSLVTRRYIMNNPGQTHLHEVVTIGAPWLGAPKLVNVLNTGDFVSPLANGSSAAIKRVASGFRATHELMSGPYFHQLAGPVFAEEGWDYDGDGTADEVYDWANLRDAINGHWPQTTPAETAETFQQEGGSDGQTDWSADSSGVDYTHIYGVQAGENTIGKVVAVKDVLCTPVVDVVCVHHSYIDQRMTQGDGTVPVLSASRVSAEDDLNAPQARLVPVVVRDEDDNGDVEHTGLTRNETVLQTIIATFRAEQEEGLRGTAARDAALAAQSATPAAYRYVTLRGARDIVVHDGRGNNDAPLDDETRIPLPGVQHLGQGVDAELVTMPAEVDHQWRVTFTGTGGPMSLLAVEGTQSRPESVVRYRDLVVPEGHDAELLLTPTGLERLRVDTDGDGGLDQLVPPTSDLVGADARDVTAPEVAVSATTVAGARRYVVSATDGDGAGVRNLRWSTDGEHFTTYTGPFDPGPATTLHAFAEDWAGNRSAIVAVDLAQVAAGPVTTATSDPAPSEKGWSAGPVTVTLSARAGESAPVERIRFRVTGAQPVEETTLDGTTASVQVSAPGTSTVWFRAEAADGTVEPWRQLPVRIDAAAPAVRLRSPAAGAVVSSITQVSGTAADDAAGVRSVEVSLERTSDGTYWDGSAWVAATTWLPAKGTGTWRMTSVPGTTQLLPGGYAVRARVTDAADRVTVSPARTFLQAHAAPWAATELAPPTGVVAHTTGLDISDEGMVAGQVGSHPSIPALWSGRLPASLGTFEDARSASVASVSGDGSAAGKAWETLSTRTWAVRWDRHGEPTRLPDLPGEVWTSAHGISSAGTVGASGNHAVLWPDGDTVIQLPTLHEGESARALDIDSAGTIVGHVTSPTGISQAVAWTDGGRKVTPLGSLGGAGSQATSINEVGQAVGWARTGRGDRRPFIVDVRDGEGMVEVYVPSYDAQAHDVDDDGTVVGEYVLGDGVTSKAFMVRGGEFARLDSLLTPGTGWDLVRARGVNNLGQVTGFGLLDGVGRAFVLSAKHPPAAADISASTDTGTPVEIELSATDPDPDSTLTYTVAAQPAHGTLGPVSGRTVTYTPAAGFTGTDSFTYRAHDGGLGSNTATVTVSVRPGAPANQKPWAVLTVPDSAPEGSVVVLDGSGSRDADGEITSYAWDLDEDGEYDDATGLTAELDVPQDGVRVVALEVRDDDGAVAATTASVTVVNVAPVLDLPATSTVEVGEPWSADGSFVDPGDDTWSATVDLGDGLGALPLGLSSRSFTVSTTFATAGTRQVRVAVCDGTECGSAVTTVTVTEAPTSTWPWEGFFAPVDNLPTVNSVKAGQAIPLKFSLGGYRGMEIFTVGHPASRAHSCDPDLPSDVLEETATPGSSALSYSAGSDEYQYVWKTQKSWAGQCRTLVLTLVDGSTHTAEFRFR